MLNIANLDPAPFAAILAGRKRTEWRWRSQPDPRLEAVQIGEPVILAERRSARAISATVRAVLRFDHPHGHLYAIRLLDPRLVRYAERRIQGWLRRQNPNPQNSRLFS